MAKNIITPTCILSYPNLFTPRVGPGKTEPEYSVALIFEEGTDLSALKSAMREAAQEKWGDKADGMLKSGMLRTPIRTDVEDRAGYPDGSCFMNVRSKNRPEVVNRRLQPIEDPNEVYAGCRAKVSIRAFAYDKAGNKGVSFGLGNVQKVADGERIDGRVPASNEFEALPDDTTSDSDDPWGGEGDSDGDDGFPF